MQILRLPPGNMNELDLADQESTVSSLKDLDHGVGTDHTDHVDNLSDVSPLQTAKNGRDNGQ